MKEILYLPFPSFCFFFFFFNYILLWLLPRVSPNIVSEPLPVTFQMPNAIMSSNFILISLSKLLDLADSCYWTLVTSMALISLQMLWFSYNLHFNLFYENYSHSPLNIETPEFHLSSCHAFSLFCVHAFSLGDFIFTFNFQNGFPYPHLSP